METVVSSAVSQANEPLLKVLDSDKYINRFMTYPTTGGNADELALIEDMCITARELTEKAINRALAEQTIVAYWSYDEAKRKDFKIDLPYGPHSRITAVVVDYADDTDDYSIIDDIYIYGNQYKSIKLANITGTSGSSEIAGYKVTFICGYGVTTENYTTETIPEALRQIMAKQVVQWYAKRDDYNAVLTQETAKALQLFSRKTWI